MTPTATATVAFILPRNRNSGAIGTSGLVQARTAQQTADKMFSSSSQSSGSIDPSDEMAHSSQEPLRVKKLNENATIPTRGSPQAAGVDLSSCEAVTVAPNSRKVIKTGLAIACPLGTYARIAPRSGLTVKKGIHVGAGVVDADYRGEVGVVVFNLGDEDWEIKVGDRIAQLILEEVRMVPVEICDSLDDTDRGAGGFGSTGVSRSVSPVPESAPSAKRAKLEEPDCAMSSASGSDSVSMSSVEESSQPDTATGNDNVAPPQMTSSTNDVAALDAPTSVDVTSPQPDMMPNHDGTLRPDAPTNNAVPMQTDTVVSDDLTVQPGVASSAKATEETTSNAEPTQVDTASSDPESMPTDPSMSDDTTLQQPDLTASANTTPTPEAPASSDTPMEPDATMNTHTTSTPDDTRSNDAPMEPNATATDAISPTHETSASCDDLGPKPDPPTSANTTVKPDPTTGTN